MTCCPCCCDLCHLLCTLILIMLLIGLVGLAIYLSVIIFWAFFGILLYYCQHVDTCYYVTKDQCKSLCKNIFFRRNNRIVNESSDESSDESSYESDIENPSIKETKLNEIIIIQNPGPIPLSIGRISNNNNIN